MVAKRWAVVEVRDVVRGLCVCDVVEVVVKWW